MNDATKMLIRAQVALMLRGYDPGPPAGFLNDETRSALKKFQKEKGLKATGTLTKETLTALEIQMAP